MASTLVLTILFFLPSLLATSSSPARVNLDPSSPANLTVDYGRIFDNRPAFALRPDAPEDIATLITSIVSNSSYDNVTIAPRGAGHSTYGQAQASGGVVVDMRSLPSDVRVGETYADVGAGALWVDVLAETLKRGLAPRSWTDYLYLTVGGTLSVAGVSGQTFKYGPQISNVLELDVITGKGERVVCSPEKNPDLFYGVLGGMGQFGIITRARIIIQPVRKMVKFVRATYDDFDQLTRDQELLIANDKVDYLEGLLELKPNPHYPIEIALYYDDERSVEEELNQILAQLKFGRTTLNVTSVSYFEFLNRVRAEETELRKRGLWEVAHPWVNFFVPRAQIKRFNDLLVDNLKDTFGAGLIKVYPVFRNKWNLKMSAMLPEINQEDDIMYIVSVLHSAPPSCKAGTQCLDTLLRQNQKLIDVSTSAPGAGMGAKQYLAYWKNEEEWKGHFGDSWERFKELKDRYDPLHVLAPGQRIFERKPI